MILLGVDPGFAWFGWVAVRLESSGEELVAAGVIRTRKSKKKSRTFAADDNVRRTRELSGVLRALVHQFRPPVICAERQSWPRNASASAKVAMAWGAMVCAAQDTPIRQVSPVELKAAVTGDRTAKKSEVEDAVRIRWPSFPELLDDVRPSQHNHAYDAAGAVIACMDSEIVRALRAV